jgi:hypothetical protein
MGTLKLPRSDDMGVTLMFRPPAGKNDEAALDFNSKRIPDALRVHLVVPPFPA